MILLFGGTISNIQWPLVEISLSQFAHGKLQIIAYDPQTESSPSVLLSTSEIERADK